MLEWYHWTLISMFAVALVAAWWVRNAVLWLSLGALCYAVTAMWHNYGFPNGVLVGAVLNFSIVALISRYAIARWEIVFGHCIVAMILIDLLYASGVIQDRYTFAVALEIVNAIAMLFVIAIGILDRIGHAGGLGYWRPVRSGYLFAFAVRKPYPPWWRRW